MCLSQSEQWRVVYGHWLQKYLSSLHCDATYAAPRTASHQCRSPRCRSSIRAHPGAYLQHQKPLKTLAGYTINEHSLTQSRCILTAVKIGNIAKHHQLGNGRYEKFLRWSCQALPANCTPPIICELINPSLPSFPFGRDISACLALAGGSTPKLIRILIIVIFNHNGLVQENILCFARSCSLRLSLNDLR